MKMRKQNVKNDKMVKKERWKNRETYWKKEKGKFKIIKKKKDNRERDKDRERKSKTI